MSTLKSRRKPTFISNFVAKTVMIIVQLLVAIALWKLLIVNMSVSMVKKQPYRNDDAPRSTSDVGAITNTAQNEILSNQQNQIVYTGSFGIGHRMNKLSCVHHLLFANMDSALNNYISIIKVEWGTCPNNNIANDKANIDIFEYLFESQFINASDAKSHDDPQHQQQILSDLNNNDLNFFGNKKLWIRNDVAGYYAGQSYKNAKIKLKGRNTFDLFNSKLNSDYNLFRYLINHRFIGYNHLQQYKHKHEWEKHYVLGVHIRAGNGEKDHFVQSGRSIVLNDDDDNNSTWHEQQIVRHIAQAIQQIYEASITLKPPLVFLATDTEHYIKALTNALQEYNIPLISFNEQPRIPKGMGVSYDNAIYFQHRNVSCYQSWYGSMIDMILLSESNTVLATTRSTFTQIVPNSIVFHRTDNHYKYCEMDLLTPKRNSSKVTCFQNQQSWLMRHNSSEWNTFCVNGDDASEEVNGCNSSQPVAHKLMVHFPDIGDHDYKHDAMYTEAIAFLRQRQPLLPNETLYFYGRKYNSKYRVRSTKGNPETIQSNWTWE